MPSIPILKQDFLINKKPILICYLCQFFSLLLAAAIRGMRLMEISDIFWDTLPVVIIPMAMEIVLAHRTVRMCEADKTMDFLLSASVTPAQVITTKAFFAALNMFLLISLSMLFGCLFHVYDLTGVWNSNTYIALNLGGMCLQLFVGGWCFLISCADRIRKKTAYWIVEAALPAALYGIYLLYYLFPRQLFLLQYITIFSLFRQELFARGSLMALLASVILAVLGLGCYGAGRYLFCGRSLRT